MAKSNGFSALNVPVPNPECDPEGVVILPLASQALEHERKLLEDQIREAVGDCRE